MKTIRFAFLAALIFGASDGHAAETPFDILLASHPSPAVQKYLTGKVQLKGINADYADRALALFTVEQGVKTLRVHPKLLTMPRRMQLMVIRHEARHAEQLARGMAPVGMFDGSMNDPRLRAWLEEDAHKYDNDF